MVNKITTLNIDDEQFKKLRSLLAMEGISVSAWLRGVIGKKIQDSEKVDSTTKTTV